MPDELVQRSLFDLQHESPVVRLRTLQGLANTPDRRLLAAVRRLLRDDDSAVRHAALQSVRAMLLHCGGTGSQAAAASLSDFERRLAGDPEEALTALQSTIDVALVAGADDVARLLMRLGPAEREPTVRASLVSSLALVGGAAAAALYRALLRDPDARVRANAVDAIELAGNDADLLATASCLADPSPRVRGAAIRACVRVSKDRFLSHLQGMLSADAVADRAAALHVARTLQFPERFDFLRDHFLAEAHPRLSEASAAALASEAVAGRRDEVLSLLAQLPAGGRRKCLRAALGLPPESNEPDAGPTLVASSGVPLDAETSGSFEMVWGLQQQGQLTPQLVRQKLASHSDPLTTVTLLQAVADQRLADAFDLTQPFTYARDRRVRLAAIAVLGGLDDPRTRACLWSLVKDRDAEVSRRALAALAATAPESAFHAACSLLEMSQPAAVRRGLELLGEMGQPAALAAVLQSLRLHVHSSTIEPLEKLVLRWGTTATLEELAAIYGDTPANARLFVAELTQTLAAHLGLPAPALTAKLPAGQMFSEAGQGLPPGQAGLAEPPAGGAVSSHRAVMAGAFVYAAVVAVVVWMVLPPDQSLAHYRAIGREENPVARPAGVKVEFRTGLAPRELGGVVQSSFDSMLRDALAANVTPTVRQVEDALRERLAAQGIRSQAFVHLVALDRVECAYQAELERAREAVQARRFDRAIELLSAALAATDPEHLVARLDLLRELELACRLGARPELARDYENQMAACERKMLEICLQAAREKGLPESTLRAALTAFDARQQRRGKARAVLELFSPPAPSSVH
ncbi:MAG: HEAT repeat domain-containing protein [Candidatus Wallbacteria bacterium]|nr:HEAT repeat domain-containing protein [Candidatus Wallbacteria bacterium]